MKFNSISKELIAQRKRTHEICRQFSRSPSHGNLRRLQALFAACGNDVFIEQGFYCDYGERISLAERVYINMNATFLDGGHISIGDDCLIGPNVQLLTVNHATRPSERLKKASYAEDICIEKNVWLGGGVIVLPGVTIGTGAVIAAGSVVAGNVDKNSLYAGNPAKKIRALKD